MKIIFKKKAFADSLELKRYEIGGDKPISMRKAADLSGIDRTVYWEMETMGNEKPDSFNLFKACDWLEVSMNMFFVKSKK